MATVSVGRLVGNGTRPSGDQTPSVKFLRSLSIFSCLDVGMVSVKVSAAGKPPSVARGLPITLDLQEDATILQVKEAIAARFPKVCAILSFIVLGSTLMRFFL